MTPRDDFPGEMEEFPFDDIAADAVFGTARGADSAPEELRDIAELVHAARRTGSADELVGEDVIVARIAAAMGEPAAPPQSGDHERIAVLKKFRTAKVTAGATAVLLLGGTAAAAAATGSLPTTAHHHHHVELAVVHTAAAPRHHETHAPGVEGAVASVNGVTVAGTCGVADTAGVFTLTSRGGNTFTANVDTTTTYAERGVTGPSFANVCVGSKVGAEGVLTGTTVAAMKVVIKPPHVRTGASGTVASVNGVAGPGTCGASGMAGAFVLTEHEGNTFTVNVDTTTAFTEDGVVAPSFGNVCVGSKVKATGTVVDTTVTATAVKIKPPHVRMGAMGTVASVNGVSDPGTCGVSGLAGSFTITAPGNKTFTVNVDLSTTFADEGVTSPSFVNVCVGEFVAAKGTVTDPIVTATEVFVAPAKHDDKKQDDHGHHVGAFGTVASVNGLSAAGACGAPGTGSFTITGHTSTTFTVNVTGTTNFKVPGVTGPTFANVCVGDKVGAKGDVTGTTVAATDVFVLPAGSGGDHHDGHQGHDHGGRHDGNSQASAGRSGKDAAKLSSDHRGGKGHNGNDN